MTKYLRVSILAGALILIGHGARAETFKIDESQSSITFAVHQLINTTHGNFKRFAGTVEVDRQRPERSSVTARIQVNSIDTGIRKRDEHLLSPEFFDAAKFPEITFKSRGVRQTGAQSGDIEGDFTMHGVTKPIILHVQLMTPLPEQGEPKQTRWSVTTNPLKRKDFNLLFSSSAEAISGIGQEVTVKIEVEAARAE